MQTGNRRDGAYAISGEPGREIPSESGLPPPEKPRRNKYAFMYAVLASMASILLGYEEGAMNGAVIFIKDDFKISDVAVEVLVGVINLYVLIGAALAGRTSDFIGRRYTMVLAGVIFFSGAFLMGFATSYASLMLGRFIAGLGVGYAFVLPPIYSAEVSPASSRGFFTSLPEVFINFGVLLGYISNLAFSKLPLNLGWRCMLGISVFPSVLLIIVVFMIPESPHWLVMQGQIGKAKWVIDKTSDSLEEAEQRLANIKEVVGIPTDYSDDVVPFQVSPRGSHTKEVWKELFLRPTPSVRHILIAAVGLHFFQQTSGLDAVFSYSPMIFEMAGIKSDSEKLLALVAVGFTKMVFILVATFLLDRIGRRLLLLISVTGNMISLAVLGFGLMVINRHSHVELTWAVGLCIAMVLAYVAFFSIGVGPITWVYCSEIFPLKLRAQGASAGVIVNRVTHGVVSMTLLSLSNAITISGAFFLFAGIAATSCVFFYVVFPETQGRTLENMEGLFGNLGRFPTKRNRDRNDVGNGNDDDNGGIQLERNEQV